MIAAGMRAGRSSSRSATSASAFWRAFLAREPTKVFSEWQEFDVGGLNVGLLMFLRDAALDLEHEADTESPGPPCSREWRLGPERYLGGHPLLPLPAVWGGGALLNWPLPRYESSPTKEGHMSRRLAACAAVLAWSLPAAALDHFECYQTVRNAGTPKVALPASLVLTDAFETVTATPKGSAANFLCNPVNKNGGGIEDPTAHLACYKMGYVHQPVFKQRGVAVANQFEDTTVQVLRRGRLCVPTSVDGVPSATAIDHFKCYAATAAPLATPASVNLADPLFGTRTGLATKVVEYCQAVSKNGEPVPVPGAHLTCYKLANLAPQFSPMAASVDNQFGTGQAVRARAIAELCVPDTTTTTTTTTITTTTASSTTTTTISCPTIPPDCNSNMVIPIGCPCTSGCPDCAGGICNTAIGMCIP